MISDIIDSSIDFVNSFFTLTPYQLAIISKSSYGFKLSKREKIELDFIIFKYSTKKRFLRWCS